LSFQSSLSCASLYHLHGTPTHKNAPTAFHIFVPLHSSHCISFHCISWRFITTQNAKVQLACLGVVQLQQSVQNVFCVMEILLRVCSTQHTDEGSNDCLLPAASSAMNYKTRCSSTSCKLQCVQGICGEITHDSQHPTQCKRHVCGFRTMG